jgi:hypothetical protein
MVKDLGYHGYLGSHSCLHCGYQVFMFTFVTMVMLFALAAMVALVIVVTVFRLVDTIYGMQQHGLWGVTSWLG